MSLEKTTQTDSVTTTELIKVAHRIIGDGQVQTVNARELHAFLGIGKDFSSWIKAQIERARLVEDRDFTKLTQKGELACIGQTRIDYFLTIESAKHISMLSGTEKGFEVREYFIECERRVKTLAIKPIKAAQEALRLACRALRFARGIGLDKNAAAISANQYAYKYTAINVLADFGHTHLKAEDQQSLWFTPTELGKRINVSPIKFNRLLVEASLQVKQGDHWTPTEAAEGFCRLFDTGKRHGDGVPVTQIKWAENVLHRVRPLQARAA